MELDNSLFHYTSAEGLYGILSSGQLWSTSQFATNDKSEMSYGYGILSKILESRDESMDSREPEMGEMYQVFEDQFWTGMQHHLTAYITSFRRARSPKEYRDGLLSHWQRYGSVDGYAIEFGRKELDDWTKEVSYDWTFYKLHDVYYDTHNQLRDQLKELSDLVLSTFVAFMVSAKVNLEDPNVSLDDEWVLVKAMQEVLKHDEVRPAIRTYLMYLAHTKNPEFSEETEVRLGVYIGRQLKLRRGYTRCFVRNGVLVPYVRSSRHAAKKLLNAITGVVIGPGEGARAKERGLQHYLLELGRPNVDVRRSELRIPRSE